MSDFHSEVVLCKCGQIPVLPLLLQRPVSAEYWDLSVCFEEYECKDKCETRTYTVQVPIEDDEEGEESGDSESDDDDDSGGGTRTETRTVKYCPGHIKGVVTLTFNWDTTKLIDKLQPGDSFEMFYDIIEEQYSKDKKGI